MKPNRCEQPLVKGANQGKPCTRVAEHRGPHRYYPRVPLANPLIVRNRDELGRILPGEVQTHCKRGHEFVEGSYYERRDGGRDCKECAKMRNAARSHDPRKKAMRRKAERKAARRADRAEYQRFWLDAKARKAGLAQHPRRRKCPKLRDEILFLPVEPFHNWLVEQLADVEDEPYYHGRDGFAKSIGFSGNASMGNFLARVRRGERVEIHIDQVDRAFIGAGDFQALEELYPLETCYHSYYGEPAPRGNGKGLKHAGPIKGTVKYPK